ncbi:hypothetical protein KP509_12G026000 [Ceratopteris richardii]|uniref:THO complex subunit 6 n=1 Tax=Ceratopteris richardii TaxID=49495 RepID=A0A8T2TN16_CERRI|nr:hypothetical protein KP509_12G026000 [Ceratopteris richardii]
MASKCQQKWDVRNWDEAAYKVRLQADREESTRIVYAARLAPSSDFVATASSNGSVCLYSVASCLASQSMDLNPKTAQLEMEPFLSFSRHDGAAYDLQFYGEDDDAILLSCGDDGKIQGWHWKRIEQGDFSNYSDGRLQKPDFILANPQQKGLRGALAPVPEINAIATDSQEGYVFSATGSGHAYCWDLEREKIITTFEGHSDYLHCICSRPSQKQVITGSEDGTVRIWDCRTAETIAILDAHKAAKVTKSPKGKLPWVSCVAIDSSQKWLVCGTGGNCLTLWSLLSFDAVTRICTVSTPQAVTIENSKIMTVGALPYLSCFTYNGDVISRIRIAPSSALSISAYSSGVCIVSGYGGLVDIISEFGSHISTFRCK